MSVTVDEMNKLSERIAELRTKEAEASNAKKLVTQELEANENEMLRLLQENDLPNFRSAFGLASISFRTSVKTPKTSAQKEAFYEFLKTLGVYEQMITVNSATLNSFYKEQLELARERGDDDFTVPGLDEVTISPILSFTRPK